MTLIKTCCHCKRILDISNFSKNRSTKDGFSFECRECKKEWAKQEYIRNPEKIKERVKKWTIDNPEKYRKRNHDYVETHKEEISERAKEWYRLNKDHKRKYDAEYRKQRINECREASKRFRQNHPGRKRADTALRRTMRINATPPWVNKLEIRKIYENCPSGYHVDHIIPLRGENCCGLHVPWNLQYLPSIENLKKGNKVQLEVYGEGK